MKDSINRLSIKNAVSKNLNFASQPSAMLNDEIMASIHVAGALIIPQSLCLVVFLR